MFQQHGRIESLTNKSLMNFCDSIVQNKEKTKFLTNCFKTCANTNMSRRWGGNILVKILFYFSVPQQFSSLMGNIKFKRRRKRRKKLQEIKAKVCFFCFYSTKINILCVLKCVCYTNAKSNKTNSCHRMKWTVTNFTITKNKKNSR